MGTMFKVITSINSFFGVIFFWSFLVTNWQAYQAHLDILQFQLDQAKKLLTGQIRPDLEGVAALAH